MKRNEFIEFCRLDENAWQKFMKETSDGPKKSWNRREKLARTDIIIQQKRETGESNRKIVTAIVDATGVSRATACKWLKQWISHHEPDTKTDDLE